MHVTAIGTLTDVGMRMRIRGSKGCNAHNDCRDRMIRGGRACRDGIKYCNILFHTIVKKINIIVLFIVIY